MTAPGRSTPAREDAPANSENAGSLTQEEIAADAVLAAILLAIDPVGLGGAWLTGLSDGGANAWLDIYRDLLPADAPMKRLPFAADEDRVMGGLDLLAALTTGERAVHRGVLAEADGGALLVRMADRLDNQRAAMIAAAMDQGAVALERSGLSKRYDARFSLVLTDATHGGDDDARPPTIVLERTAFRLQVDALTPRALAATDESAQSYRAKELAADIEAARASLDDVALPEAVLRSLDAACRSVGALSVRCLMFAARAAVAHAAFEGRTVVEDEDAAVACRLVIAPRAEFLPAPSEAPPEPEPEDTTSTDENRDEGEDSDAMTALDDMLIDATAAALPPELIAALSATGVKRTASSAVGKSGAQTRSAMRGRPKASRPGDPRRGGRIDIPATMVSAAPWQKVRGRRPGDAIRLRLSDFRLKQYKARKEAVIIVAVDASGSSAASRMAEAKGAVELLLAQSYARRDYVALIAFRGDGAEILTPPTRSLAFAKRRLADLPGGGATPLAAGLRTAAELAELESRKGRTPYLVVLSDGQANMPLDGPAGREAAETDAGRVADAIKQSGFEVIFIDTARRASDRAARLSERLAATYLKLPYTDRYAMAGAVSDLVRRRP